MILVRPSAAGRRRWIVRTTKSPPSASSVNSSPSIISVSRIKIGSSPGGVIVNAVPTANGPSIVMDSMPSFHCGHAATSDHCRQTAVALAAVSTLYSYSHMRFLLHVLYLTCAQIIFIQMICQQTICEDERYPLVCGESRWDACAWRRSAARLG